MVHEKQKGTFVAIVNSFLSFFMVSLPNQFKEDQNQYDSHQNIVQLNRSHDLAPLIEGALLLFCLLR